MLFIVIIDKFYYISIKFLFRTDQRFDPSLEGKCQKRVFPCHIFIKFPDLLGLGSKEIVMFQKFLDLDQEITVYQIDLVAFFFCFCPQIPDIFFQYPKKGISGIQVIIQCYHLCFSFLKISFFPGLHIYHYFFNQFLERLRYTVCCLLHFFMVQRFF